MGEWRRTDTGTYYRVVQRARKQRRCEDCHRVLEVGAPYVEHRAVMWSEFTDTAYSIAACGIKTDDCVRTDR